MLRTVSCLLLLLGCAPLAFANELPAAGDEAVAGELRTLSTSINRLTDLLEGRLEGREQDEMLRKLDIAISYLNFRSRRIENLQRQVQSAGNRRQRIEDILKQWDLREEALDEALRNASSTEAQEIEQTLENARIQRKILNGKMSRLDTDIIKLQNRIYDLQNQLDSVEEFVQENLALQ